MKIYAFHKEGSRIKGLQNKQRSKTPSKTRNLFNHLQTASFFFARASTNFINFIQTQLETTVKIMCETTNAGEMFAPIFSSFS